MSIYTYMYVVAARKVHMLLSYSQHKVYLISKSSKSDLEVLFGQATSLAAPCLYLG